MSTNKRNSLYEHVAIPVPHDQMQPGQRTIEYFNSHGDPIELPDLSIEPIECGRVVIDQKLLHVLIGELRHEPLEHLKDRLHTVISNSNSLIELTGRVDEVLYIANVLQQQYFNQF
jgi:hypothetical protein